VKQNIKTKSPAISLPYTINDENNGRTTVCEISSCVCSCETAPLVAASTAASLKIWFYIFYWCKLAYVNWPSLISPKLISCNQLKRWPIIQRKTGKRSKLAMINIKVY